MALRLSFFPCISQKNFILFQSKRFLGKVGIKGIDRMSKSRTFERSFQRDAKE